GPHALDLPRVRIRRDTRGGGAVRDLARLTGARRLLRHRGMSVRALVIAGLMVGCGGGSSTGSPGRDGGGPPGSDGGSSPGVDGGVPVVADAGPADPATDGELARF